MVSLGSKFECGACGLTFSTADKLKEHGRAHDREDHSGHAHLTCRACWVSFHSPEELKEHGRRYHGPLPRSTGMW
jgi:uncharacterized ferredoxin-like protein